MATKLQKVLQNLPQYKRDIFFNNSAIFKDIELQFDIDTNFGPLT